MTDKNTFTRRRALKTIAGVSGALSLAGCSGGGQNSTAEVRAAFVNLADDSDNHVRSFIDAREALNEEFDWLETSFSGSTPASDVGSVLRNYAENDFDVIFGNASTYTEVMNELAPEYPDIAWENQGGIHFNEDLNLFYARVYQGQFLAGAAAGLLTETDQVGFVAAFPISLNSRIINGAAQGLKQTNPDATMSVSWVNTWFDPPAEAEGAQSLIDQGCDVIGHWTDSSSVVRTADENNTWVWSGMYPVSDAGGDRYIGSVLYGWEPYLRERVQQVRNGEWEGNDWTWWGLERDMGRLADWGPQVPADIRSEVESLSADVQSDDVNIWAGSQFEGWTEEELYFDMSGYVDNINGTYPES